MTAAILSFNLVDVLDILLVGLIIFQVYKLIRGTVAIKIFLGIIAIYLLWKLVSALRMEMLGEILGQFIGVGVIALLIVFQQELRQFLVVIGNREFLRGAPRILRRWLNREADDAPMKLGAVVTACKSMARTRTGALIIVAKKGDPSPFITASKSIDARLSSVLLESIFFKNSPLHDGAVFIRGSRIVSAGGVLPASENERYVRGMGMRHRAALGISEQTDAIAIAISEERGTISYARFGELHNDVSPEQLQTILHGE